MHTDRYYKSNGFANHLFYSGCISSTCDFISYIPLYRLYVHGSFIYFISILFFPIFNRQFLYACKKQYFLYKWNRDNTCGDHIDSNHNFVISCGHMDFSQTGYNGKEVENVYSIKACKQKNKAGHSAG